MIVQPLAAKILAALATGNLSMLQNSLDDAAALTPDGRSALESEQRELLSVIAAQMRESIGRMQAGGGGLEELGVSLQLLQHLSSGPGAGRQANRAFRESHATPGVSAPSARGRLCRRSAAFRLSLLPEKDAGSPDSSGRPQSCTASRKARS